MSIRGKKILSLITYYTLFGIAIIMAAMTILFVLNRAVPMWAKVLYVLWSCVVIGTLIFDVVCTSTKRMKFISGVLVYVLSIVSIIVTAILYLVSAGLTTGLTTIFMPVYTGIAAIVLSTSIYMIATFIVGEAVVEHKSALKSIKEKQN
ncbi:MAG: hypothetical protein IJ458_00800 [Clostridia bacterium]|nr:hypothetical protein [Clostridia bacterium]